MSSQARLYYRKWDWFERGLRPWNVLALHRELMKRGAYMRGPLEGNVLWALRDGRMEIGEGAHFEPHAWISVLERARLTIGAGVAVNAGVFVSVVESVEIGAGTALSNGVFVSDGQHRFDGPPTPFLHQGMWSKGPLRIGENVWVGVNAAVMGNVTIGDWSIIGANSVVTHDVPPGCVAVGTPARVIRELPFRAALEERP
jgi:acetyltransferase-like isoleucine patch superfamily enzyme